MRTLCPKLDSSRAQKCAVPQASMPIRHGSGEAKNGQLYSAEPSPNHHLAVFKDRWSFMRFAGLALHDAVPDAKTDLALP
jgi:hypothetical protein